ncbi:uncharacterized protein LOC106153385 [Lingula anatina]|uniref:Uncharacterized protein LOC106153385 n=1 Tax=Lingula anatina TaxID=7574 RepID=A0A1S3H9R8_LINAN|nr:uncharacterized protein LOC106153385 [Lingula anatina]|eukprot:XP_013382747.1 uncharacterized protein LOC106153385 [Lingula anatina]
MTSMKPSTTPKPPSSTKDKPSTKPSQDESTTKPGDGKTGTGGKTEAQKAEQTDKTAVYASVGVIGGVVLIVVVVVISVFVIRTKAWTRLRHTFNSAETISYDNAAYTELGPNTQSSADLYNPLYASIAKDRATIPIKPYSVGESMS